jgi:hypothetical protein
MEFMLLLWDEWDDLTGACQHLVATTADELTGIRTSFATAGSAVGMWVVTVFSGLTAFFR